MALVATILTSAQTASAQILFDASLGTTPSAQDWPFVADPLFGNSVMETAGPEFSALDSLMPITDRGGYFSRDPLLGTWIHPNMPSIDRQVGYTIRFDMRIHTENHVTGAAGDNNGDGLDDRAGFSVIAISEDLEGIELGFWEDRIWAQEDDAPGLSLLFTQAEGVEHDTTATMLRYDLQVFGDRYQLVTGGGVAPRLAGPLRNYSNFSGTLDPYEIPSFLFFGDNTMRGEARVELAFIEVAAIPTPCEQADALVAEIVAQSHSPFFDLNGDGLVNQTDLADWLVTAGELYLGEGSAFLPGDANFDGVVDGQDFIIWNDHKFTVASGWCVGDFTADGVVDGQDFITWNDHKFQASDQPSLLVPEVAGLPGATGALLIALLCGRCRQRSCSLGP